MLANLYKSEPFTENVLCFTGTVHMWPTTSREDSPTDSYSYLYISLWSYWFYFRQVVLGRVTPFVLLFLFGLDMIGPVAHIAPFAERRKLLIDFALLFVAAVLVWHHHRLQRRIERLQIVLTSTMVILDELGDIKKKPAGEQARRSAVTSILDAFVFALEKHYPNQNVAASVVISESSGEPFKIFAQDPRLPFNDRVTLHHAESAAGCTAIQAAGTLIYVPRTKFVHAARIGAIGVPSKSPIFRKVRIVPNAFQSRPEDPSHLCSLLCVKIPIRGNVGAKTAILCLSRSKPDGMGDLEFHVIKLAAVLVGIAIGR